MSARPLVVSSLMLWGLLSTAAGCSGCSRPIDPDPEADAGTNGPIACQTDLDCGDPNVFDCLGVCMRICQGNDTLCPEGERCNAGGYCETGCRNSTNCDADQVCDDGVCVPRPDEGCQTKCDCDVGQVCRDRVCQEAGLTCQTTDDCARGPTGAEDRCLAYECNGFTDRCFDPEPQPCVDSTECRGRPGCTTTSPCTCTADGQCVPDVACTVAEENTLCGPGNFCTGGGACSVLPACDVDETVCDALGLACNGGSGRCERSLPCTDSSDCTLPPASFCDPTTQFCAVATCINGGRTCEGDQDCTEDGRCVPAGTGTPCAADPECPPNQYCNFALNPDQCSLGCRTNDDCDTGQSCDGNHRCVGGGDALPFGATCQADAECITGLCGTQTGTCAELCPFLGGDCTFCPQVNPQGCGCVTVALFQFCQPLPPAGP